MNKAHSSILNLAFAGNLTESVFSNLFGLAENDAQKNQPTTNPAIEPVMIRTRFVDS